MRSYSGGFIVGVFFFFFFKIKKRFGKKKNNCKIRVNKLEILLKIKRDKRKKINLSFFRQKYISLDKGKKERVKCKNVGLVEYGRDMRVEFEKPSGKVIIFYRELKIYFYGNILFKPNSQGFFFNHKIEDPKQGNF